MMLPQEHTRSEMSASCRNAMVVRGFLYVLEAIAYTQTMLEETTAGGVFFVSNIAALCLFPLKIT